MKPYFTVKRSLFSLIVMLFIGVFFTLFGLFYSGILNPFTLISGGNFPVFVSNRNFGFSIFTAFGILFALIGVALTAYTLYLLFARPVILTASSEAIRFGNDRYPVNQIEQFVIVSYYSKSVGNNDGMEFREYLVINGKRGAKRINIRHKKIKTDELIHLLEDYYANIPVVITY